MTFGFTTRIAFVLAMILAAGMAMTGLLSVHKYERTLADLLTSRFTFVANDISQRIETQMEFGLALQQLQDVAEEMQAYMRDDGQILSIEVFDRGGTVLFSTDPSFVGDLVAEEWLQGGRGRDAGAVWSMLQRDAGVVGVPLRNDLDQEVGALALRYSRAFLDDSVDAQIERLLLIGALVVLAVSVLGVLGAMALLRGPHKQLLGLREAIDEVANRRSDGKGLAWARQEHPEFSAFAAGVLNAHAELDSASNEIRRLDEEEA